MEIITLKENLVNIMKGLVEQLNKASEAYYSGHAEIMSDKEWNDKFDELTALEKETGVILPDSPTHNVSAAIETPTANSYQYSMNMQHYHQQKQNLLMIQLKVISIDEFYNFEYYRQNSEVFTSWIKPIFLCKNSNLFICHIYNKKGV